MRILFIHEVNYSNKVIFEMHEFPELLALKGHEVAFFHFPESPDAPHASLRTTRSKIPGRVHPAAQIELITPPTFGGGLVERYLAPLLNIPSLRREIRRGNYDVIVLYAVPTTGWQTIAIARRARVPVVFRALDVSHAIRKTVLARLIRRAERYIYRNADLVSANNPALAEYCVRISGRTRPTRVDLPPIDLSHFSDAEKGTMRATLGLDSSLKIVLYMGSFFTFSGLDVVVETMVQEFAVHPELRLILVGGGEIDELLRRKSHELGIADRVIFTGLIPYADLPQYLQMADVAINPFVPQLLTNVALPHKILQYMASGVPVVSSSLDGIRGILGDDAGVTWASGPVGVVRDAVALAFADQSIRKDLALRQSRVVAERFSHDASALSFEEALESVE
jgi:glycosyltransferase involved in cell wall biosynthesis